MRRVGCIDIASSHTPENHPPEQNSQDAKPKVAGKKAAVKTATPVKASPARNTLGGSFLHPFIDLTHAGGVTLPSGFASPGIRRVGLSKRTCGPALHAYLDKD